MGRKEVVIFVGYLCSATLFVLITEGPVDDEKC
jgi:hypothetical protein